METVIHLHKLVKDKFTYPSWTTNSVYPLGSIHSKQKSTIYYKTKTNKVISREFPKIVNLTPQFIYVLGILKGEGSSSLGKSNYRRFTITNSNPKVLSIVLNELEKAKLFSRSDLIKNSVYVMHHKESNLKVIYYWSKMLSIPKYKFKCFRSEKQTSKYGVCHIYISDVLLRRIVDLMHEQLMK